jgi:4-amino-4-deoxy-L-arabinose transferase-like glycosyltransferase
MFHRFHHRAGHYALLVAVAASLFLVNLGGPSLWDIDEGNNSEASREMMEADNLVVPTFNFELRTDKPALLYWLQIGAYSLFGVNEFAARLPSALAALATVLLTYELGRRMFGAGTGLLAGLILASTALFCASAHFANPDALLLACTTLALLFFWNSFACSGRGWFVPAGISTALAVLAKGPVGVLLPGAVVFLFLLWSRQLGRLCDRRLGWGILAFLLVALPWYAWVTAETKGAFTRGFLWTHNVDRYRSPMENHGGPGFYYALVLVAGFAPWSAFLGLTAWYGLKALRQPKATGPAVPAETNAGDPRGACRFLWCWIGVYFAFFSLSGTKLPNYILPLYPATALLTAFFLDRWRLGVLQPSPWALQLSLIGLALMGIGAGAGLFTTSGVIPFRFLRGHAFPGLEYLALLGLLPVAAAAGGWWLLRRQRRGELVAAVAAATVLFTGALAAWGGSVLNDQKAPKELAWVIHAHQTEPDIRIGCHQYFQPSLVFYCRREVARLDEEKQAVEFLKGPLPVYLCVPAPIWDGLKKRLDQTYSILGRQRDLYRNCDILVVSNRE